jgi:hypothetical protein
LGAYGACGNNFPYALFVYPVISDPIQHCTKTYIVT